MSRISNIETAILGLVCERPQYGYELEKVIEERGMRNWTEIGFSSIYYVLKRLEKRGLIVGKLKSVEGKPARRVYSVSENGKRIMHQKIKQLLSEHTYIKSPFDLGIANLMFIPPKEVLDCLRQYLDSLENLLEPLEARYSEMKDARVPLYVLGLFTRPMAHLKAEKAWVEQFIIDFKQEKNVIMGGE